MEATISGAELGEDDKINVPAVIIILQLCYSTSGPPRARLKMSRDTHMLLCPISDNFLMKSAVKIREEH